MTSASAPAGTAPRNIGRVAATCTNDTTRGDGSRLVISQPEAALDIQPPILEITVTVQRTVNAACRNGLHADVAGSGVAVFMGRPVSLCARQLRDRGERGERRRRGIQACRAALSWKHCWTRKPFICGGRNYQRAQDAGRNCCGLRRHAPACVLIEPIEDMIGIILILDNQRLLTLQSADCCYRHEAVRPGTSAQARCPNVNLAHSFGFGERSQSSRSSSET
jgi:hypothetical protein